MLASMVEREQQKARRCLMSQSHMSQRHIFPFLRWQGCKHAFFGVIMPFYLRKHGFYERNHTFYRRNHDFYKRKHSVYKRKHSVYKRKHGFYRRKVCHHGKTATACRTIASCSDS